MSRAMNTTFAFTVAKRVIKGTAVGTVMLLAGSASLAQEVRTTSMNVYPWRNPSPDLNVAQQIPHTIDTSPEKTHSQATVASPRSGLMRVAFWKQDQPQGLIDTQVSASDQILTQPAPTEEPIVRVVPTDRAAASEPVPDAPPTGPVDWASLPKLCVPDAGELPEPNYCCRDCRKPCCNLGCPKQLYPRNCNGLEIGGWLSLGYHNRNNILFNNRKAEANLHQAWMYFDKQAGVTSDWGYHADLVYGIDGDNLQAFGNSPTGAPSGWDNGWDFGAYAWALPTAYLQYNNQLWDVKIGKFFSPFGYEVVAAPENFFYSHSYTMFFSEPFTMSGIVGERQVTDNRSIILGATSGWDTGFESNDNGFNIITGTRYQPNEFVNLALTSSLGDTGYRNSGTLTSGVAQLKLTENVDYVFQADVVNLQTNDEFGIVQYLFREINPCLKLGTRLEWWKSDQLFADTKSTYEFTMGANYRPHANLVLRPELRFDWGAAAVDPGTPIIGFDAVMTF